MVGFNRAFFFDRDGIINRAIVRNGKPYSPKNLKELKLYKKVPETLKYLKNLGFKIIIVTNQPEISRKSLKKKDLFKINQKILKFTNADDMFVCGHDDQHNCSCRKPKPGMLIKAAKKWKINLEKSYIVGDRYKDIEAGNQAKCKSIYMFRNYKNDKVTKKYFIRINKIEEIKKIKL